MILMLGVFVSSAEGSVLAAEVGQSREASIVVLRATGKFDIEVPGNTAVKANSRFPLEIGEVVTIKASYSPFSASVDIGLIAREKYV